MAPSRVSETLRRTFLRRTLTLWGWWGATVCLSAGWAPHAEAPALRAAPVPRPVASAELEPNDWAQRWWVPGNAGVFDGAELCVVELRGAWSDAELRGLSGLRSLRSADGPAIAVALVVAEQRAELDPQWVAAAQRAGVALGQGESAWLSAQHGIPSTWPQTRVISADGSTLFRGSPAAAGWVVERWRAGDWGGATDTGRLNAALEALAGLKPELSPRVRLARLSELQQTQPDLRELTYHAEFAALLDLGHTREAWSLGRTWLAHATARGDAVALEHLVSEVLANRPKVWMPDLELGLRAARSACEWTGQRDAPLLAQLARVHYLRGEFDRACEVMERALERAQRTADLGAEELATWRACQERYDRAAGG